MRSLIIVFCLFGLALCAPQYYSSELEGLNDAQQQQQQQPQQDQQRVGSERINVRDEIERRRLGEQLGRRVESEEATPRREAIVILRPTVVENGAQQQQQTESELYDGSRQEQDRSAAPGLLIPHHTRSHKLAARFAVRRVQDTIQLVPIQQQQQQQQSGNEEEETTTTTEEPSTSTTSEEPSTTTEEETTTSTEEPSQNNNTERPEFVSDAGAVVNSRTVTTFKARKNVNGKQVTVLGRTMALRSSFMNVLRPLIKQRDESEQRDETEEERREREKAKNVKIVQFNQVQAIRSSKTVITQDVPTF